MGKKINKTVFVGVSGGVDSSVSAALLKDQGYNVVGVFIRTWQPDFIECTWRDERRDAMRVCAHLGIPFLECDAEDAYKKGVADYMIEEYKKGHTPNPDVMCNREVKFGVFWDFAKKHGADFIATGHYAQNNYKLHPPGWLGRTGITNYELRKGEDESKDQSYFLWTLTQDDLAHTLFPIGHLQKSEVRKLAEKYKLPTATKKDSQGVCFLGPLDMKDFLKHYIPSIKGDVVDENGKVIGYHDGAVFFTLGERHGFTINNEHSSKIPYYVIKKDIDKNIIRVSPKQGLGLSNQKEYELYNVNLGVDVIKANENKEYTAQIRYHGELLKCQFKIKSKDRIIVSFKEPVLVSAGQSIVIYDGDVCMAGGIVL